MNKQIVKGVVIAVLIVLGMRTEAAEWKTDFGQASSNALKTGRYMLLDFSGSDWCGWCIKLDKEVFSTPDFKTYSKKSLECVLVDFPRRKKQAPELKKQNEALARKYEIRGYPTVIILSPEGELAGQTGYQPGGGKAYVSHVKGIIEQYEKQHPRKKQEKTAASTTGVGTGK